MLNGHRSPDVRQFAPATQRNRGPILAVLRDELPDSGTVLEVASGTGEHAVHFASALPQLDWQPSDPSREAMASIEAWRASADAPNLLAPIELDAAANDWPLARADAIVCINMVHISPWQATEGLMRGAGRLLHDGAPLILYGPYRREGHVLEASNAAFDQSLRSRDPRWGLRLLEDVAACAAGQGLALVRTVEMPANNLMVIFRRR
jgi:SAM-dependent methyltransferase